MSRHGTRQRYAGKARTAGRVGKRASGIPREEALRVQGAEITNCPLCARRISVTTTGRVRTHNHNGEPCPGAGVVISPRAVELTELPAVTTGSGAGVRHNNGSRGTPNSALCPCCGRQTPIVGLGVLKRHRTDPDVYAGPYCNGSGKATS